MWPDKYHASCQVISPVYLTLSAGKGLALGIVAGSRFTDDCRDHLYILLSSSHQSGEGFHLGDDVYDPDWWLDRLQWYLHVFVQT